MKENKYWQRYGIVFISSLLSAVLAIMGYRLLEPTPPQNGSGYNDVSHYAYNADPLTDAHIDLFRSSAPTSFIDAADRIISSVVFIRTYEKRGLFGNTSLTISSGSGVVITADGYIVTNNHVVAGGQHIEVTLNDKREFSADVIGTDPATDLALLKITAENLRFAQMGNSDSLRIGEWVMAVGNPFNLEGTVTAGIVSAKGRSIDILKGQDRIESFIQTDAVVNPGNSGGALVNTRGELIGVNTAIISRSGSYEGYSFAVPTNIVRKVVHDLRDYGLVQRGLLGAYIESLDNARARELHMKRVEGVYVTGIAVGSGAEDAGLQRGDVVTGINGIKVRTAPEMQEQLGRYRPGNNITVQYIRDRKAAVLQVMLKNKSNSVDIVTAQEESLLKDLGFEIRNLTEAEIVAIGSAGIKVVSIFRGGTIASTNMVPGFMITAINETPVNDVNELIRELKRRKGEVVLKGVYEELEDPYYYSFELER